MLFECGAVSNASAEHILFLVLPERAGFPTASEQKSSGRQQIEVSSMEWTMFWKADPLECCVASTTSAGHILIKLPGKAGFTTANEMLLLVGRQSVICGSTISSLDCYVE